MKVVHSLDKNEKLEANQEVEAGSYARSSFLYLF